MIDIAAIYIDKARESLAGAESEFANHRYNNCANRSYYACFLAGIAALFRAGVRPSGPNLSWSHRFVAARFDGDLINRRKIYSSELRNVISHNHVVRLRADYDEESVTQTEANRSLRRSRAFVTAVTAEGGGAR